MYMRADRLIYMLLLLQIHHRMTAAELARHLEVSERTIYRDVIDLSTAGIPLYTDRGPQGGISLLEGYRTSLTGLTREQAAALFALSIPSALDELGLGKELRAALLKIASSLPSTQRSEETRIRQRIHIDLNEDTPSNEPAPYLQTLQQAVWQDRVVHIRYRSLYNRTADPLEAQAQPFGLVSRTGSWYLVIYKPTPNTPMGYLLVIRLETILDVKTLEHTFTRPEDFNLADFWKKWWADHRSRRPNYPVRLRASLEACQNLAGVAGNQAYTALQNASPPDESGWVELTLVFDYLETARARLFTLGGEVEVLEPLALRLSLSDFAAQVLRRYQ